MNVCRAEINDHLELTKITMLSKAHWGYSDQQMRAWEAELTVSPHYIDSNLVYKLTKDGKILGYYSFIVEKDATFQLDNLFVLPECIGKGLGQKLLFHAINLARSKGVNRIQLAADPNAIDFYLKFDFQIIGQMPTQIEGRFLPLMELIL